jgi:hypothetical protein
MTTPSLPLAASAALLILFPMAAPPVLADDPSKPLARSQGRIELSLAPDAAAALSEAETARLTEILETTHAAVQADFPALTDGVRVELSLMDRDLEMVGGVTGRADAPGEIVIAISSVYPGGVSAAIETGLASTFAHELHHLVRGWTIQGNHFGPGIDIAAVNEGLAVAYSESLTGQAFAGNAPPEAETAHAWALEVRALPRDALAGSGLDIIELSEKSPEEIWDLSGLE